MKYRMMTLLRFFGMLVAALWFIACMVDWWFCGSYAVCGVGARVVGFFAWGILFTMGLVALAAPPAVVKSEHLRWAAPMRMRRLLPLFGWVIGLFVPAGDIPLSTPHGDMLAWLGFFWFGAFCLGVLVLALLGRVPEKLVAQCL